MTENIIKYAVLISDAIAPFMVSLFAFTIVGSIFKWQFWVLLFVFVILHEVAYMRGMDAGINIGDKDYPELFK